MGEVCNQVLKKTRGRVGLGLQKKESVHGQRQRSYILSQGGSLPNPLGATALRQQVE